MYNVQFTIYSEQCTIYSLCSVQTKVYIAQSAVSNVKCSVQSAVSNVQLQFPMYSYSVQSTVTLYNVQCTLYNVQCTMYSTVQFTTVHIFQDKLYTSLILEYNLIETLQIIQIKVEFYKTPT